MENSETFYQIYYKTSSDIRLRKEGNNIVLARIYPRKRDKKLKFKIARRDETTGRIISSYKVIEVSINDIIEENKENLLELLTELEESYKNLYR